ncbi:MAG TPA: sulfotransferase family 2 domain-containing protein [Gaiellaceae bacterium]|nr:sulfotransferase family 2 domain-containing protein [Gaiellaceae bacterium]
MSERLELPQTAARTAAPADVGEDDLRRGPEDPFPNHVEQRTIVLPEQRVVYLPVPKAGWTTIGWLLAEVAGLPRSLFEHSTLPSVSTGLTIHDMQLWGVGYRLADYEGEERERVLGEDGWFRFSVVRDPAPRLWSAWQSKLLFREPRFLESFGDEPWFPRVPETPADLLEDFRRFAAAAARNEAVDVHWAVQHELIERLPLEHVGRLEHLGETLERLREHLGATRWPTEMRRENRTPVVLAPGAYDTETAEAVNARYAVDFETYGYDPVEPSADDVATIAWAEGVETLLPLIRDTIDKHARIGQLHSVARRVRHLERRESRQLGHANAPVLTNLESRRDFDVVWAWSEAQPVPGFTAVIRAKNEAEALPWVLPPLFRAVDQVVLVDNDSTDGTADVARSLAAEAGAHARLHVHSYPFSVARCGEEHLATPADSVHSLVYFYNWSFSHVRTSYVLKWDADMVLTDAAAGVLRDLAWQLEGDQVVIKIPRYPLYVVDDRRAFLDIGMSNREPWAWPNRPGYGFVKAMEWEQPLWPTDVATIVLPDWSCVELKRLDADEFAHWSHTDFGASARTHRKRREWEVFNSLAHGGEPPSEVIRVEAPDGTHVIEHVRSRVLPEMASRRSDLGERLIRRLTA